MRAILVTPPCFKGMPAYPSPLQHEQIMDASQMVPSTVPLLPTIQEEGGSSAHRRQMQLTIIAARHSITAVDITLDECTVNDVAAGLP